MKLFRYRDGNNVKPGVLIDGQYLDLTDFCSDLNEDFFASAKLESLGLWLKTNSKNCRVVDPKGIYAPCVARPSKIVCVGLNYRKHALESGMNIPTEPVLFFKSTTAICGPYDNLVIPKGSEKTDWEVELAVVVSQEARHVKESEAYNYIAGYCVHNDYSERAFQIERGGQWVKGKSCDTFAPLGPYLVTKDEIKDPGNLKLWLSVNGEIQQSSNTSDLIFPIPFLISYISSFMTLLPGDVITTGTPEGVGLGHKPPKYILAGDVIKLGIEGLGEQSQLAVAYESTN